MRRLEVALSFGVDADGRPIPDRVVGTLAESGRTRVFEYDATFLAAPLMLSPVHLAPRAGLFEHPDPDFDRLPGVFADSLPDGFGRLVQDLAFGRAGHSRTRLSPLDRLAAIGASGMGALVYRPVVPLASEPSQDAWDFDLAGLADQGQRLLEGSAEEVLPALLATGGSPAGARPKVLAGVYPDGSIIAGVPMGTALALPADVLPYLIKFTSADEDRQYGGDAGVVEYVYWRMARAAGLDVPDAHLFTARDGRRWFGAARFDRHGPGGIGRRHLHTLGGLLHASHRVPSLDYGAYLTLTMRLTRDMRQVELAFRHMVFNVMAHNRDDHARNFAFLMDDRGAWRVAPAYDLTFSAGMDGHHTMAIGGETWAPTVQAMRALGLAAGLDGKRVAGVLEQVSAAVAQWRIDAEDVGVSPTVVRRIEVELDRVGRELLRPLRGRSEQGGRPG